MRPTWFLERQCAGGGRLPGDPRHLAAAAAAILLAAAMALGVSACPAPAEPGDPLPGLTPAERARFDRGREAFARVFTEAAGLGPLFNADACAECHEDPVAGGPGDEVEVHATALLADGRCDSLEAAGGPVIQQRATPALVRSLGIEEEPVPPGAAVARRTTPDLFGFGLLDAVPEEAILALADPEDRDGDGVSGRPHRLSDGRLGRFGRKASVATLEEFNDEAFLIEQGITSPAFPEEGSIGGRPVPPEADPAADPEIDQETLDRTDDFVRFLAPPAPGGRGPESWRGRRLFRAIGCASCHVPTLWTGRHEVRALSRRPVDAYTDLLLHDMGPDLADICLGEAAPAEFRTEPLMGLRFSERFLHDGRAATIEEAVRLHGGEAARSRDRFNALKERDRRALLEFLERL